jgi:hypothetical protein
LPYRFDIFLKNPSNMKASIPQAAHVRIVTVPVRGIIKYEIYGMPALQLETQN